MKKILLSFSLLISLGFNAQTPGTESQTPYIFCDQLRGTFQIETNTRLPLSAHINMCDLITEKRHATEVVRFVYSNNITLVIIPQSAIDNAAFITKEIIYVK
jgi:hypothetical protein